MRFDIVGMLDDLALRELIVTELEARRTQVASSRSRDRTRVYGDPIPELNVERANLLADISHRRGAAEIDAWISWLERTLRELDESGVTNPPHDQTAAGGQ